MSSISRLPNPILEGMGFDSVGLRQPISVNIEEQLVNTRQYFADNGIEGQRIENLSVGKLKAGTLMVDTYLQSTGYVTGSTGWRIDGAGNAEFNNLTLTGGSINFGKTSFSDSTNAGYYISADGFYIGAASDTTKLKYTLATGLFDFIGTISSRSTATVASAINSSGNLITDVINARLDSSAATILSDFDFGSTDYAGAVNAGGVTWDTTTGAITGGSGVILYRKGIVGVNSGATTFSIDATTGAATFAGALSAPTGTIGGFTIGASSLSVTSGGNTTTVSSGATPFSSGPTGAPTFSVTDAGVMTCTSVNSTIYGATIGTFGTSGEAISAGQAVYLKAADGKLWKSVGTSDEAAFAFVGIAISTVAAADLTVTYARPGDIASSGLTVVAGTPYYVTDTAGTIGSTPGTREVMVARAISTTAVRVIEPRFAARGTAIINTAATWTFTCGFYPTTINIRCWPGAGTSSFSYGSLDGYCIFAEDAGTAGQFKIVNHVYQVTATGTGVYSYGDISGRSATGFTILSVRPTNINAYVYWEALA